MLHSIVHLWYAPASALLLCLAYVVWKCKGGSLLFRSKRTDDGTTRVMKVILAAGWIYGSVIVSIWVCVVSILWLVVSAIGAVLGY